MSDVEFTTTQQVVRFTDDSGDVNFTADGGAVTFTASTSVAVLDGGSGSGTKTWVVDFLGSIGPGFDTLVPLGTFGTLSWGPDYLLGQTPWGEFYTLQASEGDVLACAQYLDGSFASVPANETLYTLTGGVWVKNTGTGNVPVEGDRFVLADWTRLPVTAQRPWSLGITATTHGVGTAEQHIEGDNLQITRATVGFSTGFATVAATGDDTTIGNSGVPVGTIFVDASGGNVVRTPVLADMTPGRMIQYVRVDNTGNTVTVSGVVGGTNPYPLSNQWDRVRLVSDGTRWVIVDKVAGSGGSGDVTGPSSSVNGRAAIFSGTTGKVIAQASAAPMLVGDAPTAHAASHGSGGGDPITVAQSQVTNLTTDLAAKVGTSDSRLTDARRPQWARVTFSDADYTVTATTSTIVAQTGTLSATRTVSMPLAASCPAGTEIIVVAGAGCSTTNPLLIARQGSDTFNDNSGGSVAINVAYGWRRFVSDGVSKWTWDADLGLRPASNLGDLTNAATALSNLGGVPTTRTVTAGTGLTGGGDLSADRTLSVSYGTTAGTAAQGNDSRLSDARQPTGSAGGDLTGTYPTPTIANSAVTSAKIADGTIVNADINASAAIALSKLATDPLARANHTGTQAASTITNGTRGQALISGASAPEWAFITTSQQTPVAANDWVPLWGPFGAGTTTSTVGGTATASNSAARYLPFWIGKRIGVTGLGIEVAVGNAGASAVIRMGIHSDSSGRPGAVVQDAGTASAAAAAKELTFTEVFLDPGWYWAVVAFQSLDTAGTNPTLRCASTFNGTPAPRTSVPASATQAQLFAATVSGALAGTPTVSAATTAIVPCIWLKVSTP